LLKNAKKALRVSKRKTIINSRVKSRAKSAVDTFLKSPSAEGLSKVFSTVDRSAKRNIIHPNKAARIKARMSKLVSA
jgi:ribosomal protein S20